MSNLEHNHSFEALLNYIKRHRGFDLMSYKRSGLMRRVNKRMQEVKLESYIDYLDYLEVHPDEFAFLFNTLLINVTSFFRDPSFWDYLRSEILPQIVTTNGGNEPIRIWSAGCASGEEAYSLAIALAEVIGVEQCREQVKIYATDLDEEALNHARQAAYLPRDLTPVPPELIDKYFEQIEEQYIFRKDLRRCVIFGRHDLLQDAPISRIDLLTCRNTLMYFNSEAQAKLLTKFHFALKDWGFLGLGRAEMLLTHNSTFIPVDLKQRLFSKVPKVNQRDNLLLTAQPDTETTNLTNHEQLREAAYDINPVAQIVVGVDGLLALVNERARTMFALTPTDRGRPLQDLELSYRPVELRSCIEQVYTERRIIVLKEVKWAISKSELRYLEVQFSPVTDDNGILLGVSITFTDTSRYQQLQEEIEHSNQELEMAYEELQSTNEELETTNEELQSTVEELETTNEELQSTNEELETMNEELQSTNEELQTMNEELRCRSSELNKANFFLQSILGSMRDGVVVVDQDLQIQLWNHKAEDLWGLRFEEVEGQYLLSLDIGLPLEQLLPPIRVCLSGNTEFEEITLPATNRRGRKIQCKVTCTPLLSIEEGNRGTMLLMEDSEQI